LLRRYSAFVFEKPGFAAEFVAAVLPDLKA
jgi:hypothetical protein